MTKRSNANRSGGPRSAAGKMVASRNSTRLGVYASQIILPGENPEDFAELEALFLDDFQPQGIAEAAMVRDLAVLTWKKMRLEGVEHRQIMDYMESTPSEYDFERAGVELKKGADAFALNPYLVDEYDIPNFRDRLLQLKWLRTSAKDEAALVKLMEVGEGTFAALLQKMESYGLKEPTPKSMAESTYSKGNSLTEGRRPLDDAIAAIQEEAEKVIWAADNQQILLEAHKKIRDMRLASVINQDKNQRAHDFLVRGFYKTLSELRKHQEWHRKQQVIDVTPESSVKTD